MIVGLTAGRPAGRPNNGRFEIFKILYQLLFAELNEGTLLSQSNQCILVSFLSEEHFEACCGGVKQ